MFNNFLDKTSLTTRIFLHFSLITFILITIFFVIYNYLEKEIKRTHHNNLISIREIKKNQIIDYFEHKDSEVVRFTDIPFVKKASIELASPKRELVYEKYDNLFRQYMSNNEFENIYLISTKNDQIIYSLNSKKMETKKITETIFDKSNFQQLYYSLIIDRDFLKMSDFEFLKVNGVKPTAFYATPVFDQKENITAILFLQISIDAIERIMTGNKNWRDEGLGQSGETYIIANDCKMRNDSRFFIEDKQKFLQQIKQHDISSLIINKMQQYNTNVLLQEINPQYCKKLFTQKKSGITLIEDYRGIKVLSAYAPLNVNGVNWVLLSEIDESEVFQTAKFLKEMMVITILFIIIVLLVSTYLFSKATSKPLNTIIKAFKELGKGNFTKKIYVTNKEFKILAKRYNQSLDKLQKLTSSVEYLSVISTTDFLTQVYNRQKFLEELNNNIKRVSRTQEPFCIAMIDIDHFKKINDTFGHERGDEILKTFATIVKSSLRQTDILARWGGEEFIVLFINTNVGDAKNVCEKIRQNIEAQKFEKIKSLTCSIGVTQFKHNDGEKSIIHRADLALYEAKDTGRNSVVMR